MRLFIDAPIRTCNNLFFLLFYLTIRWFRLGSTVFYRRFLMSTDREFTKIYDEYYPKILRYIIRISGLNDADDIAQDVFGKVNSGLEGFQGKSKLSNWRLIRCSSLSKVSMAIAGWAAFASSIDRISSSTSAITRAHHACI